LKNGTNQPVKGKLKGQIENVNFEQEVELAANETERRHLHSRPVPNNSSSQIRAVVACTDGQAESLSAVDGVRGQRLVSDRSQTAVRHSRSDFRLNATGGRAFHINGKNILIRGGGWTPDMMLRENSQRLHDEFRYVETWA
jgi:exo-1,4-beta-D-glucosaminidase